MSRKIVVLNGSPRPKGNTSALIDNFPAVLANLVAMSRFSSSIK